MDAVSAAIMAAVLEERQRERARQHCSTCTCGSTHTPPSNPSMEDDPNGNRDTPHTSHTRPQGGEGDTSGFSVNVVDVGTQVFPSYIGETGKVQSTCIYCHHSSRAPAPPHTTDRTLEVNGKTARSQDESTQGHHPKAVSPDSAWDWAAEGQDSGSPSTPSSLVSASLSYESETSNVTSPQESPGRLSLPPKGMRFQGCVVESPRGGVGCVGIAGSGVVASKSPLNSPLGCGVGNGVARQAFASHPHSHPIPLMIPSTTATQSLPHSTTSHSPPPQPQNTITTIPPSATQPITMTTTTQHHGRQHRGSSTSHYHHSSHRVPFSTRSPAHDVFTPPIHRSPPHRETPRSWSTDIVASSTYTSSSTETTL